MNKELEDFDKPLALLSTMGQLRKQNSLILSTPGSNHGYLIERTDKLKQLIDKVLYEY